MLKKNLIANYLGQGWTALMSLAFVPFYIKYLGIEAYGVIGLYAVLQAWLSLLDMGMTPVLGREMARFTGGAHSAQSIRDLLRSIEITAVGVAVLIASGVALGADWVATAWLKTDALPTGVVAQAFTIMGIVTALRFVEGVYRSAIIGLQRQVLFNVVNSVMATLRGLGAVGIVVWVSPTIAAFFLWQGAVSIATLGILGVTTYASMPKGERGGRFSLGALRSVWRFAGGMVGIAFLVLLLTQVDKVILSKLLTLTEYGYYTLAAAVAGTVFMVIGPIAQAWYPRFCALHAANQSAELAAAYHQATQLVTVVAGSLTVVVALFARELLMLWTQNAELAARAAPIVSLLMLGNLLNGFMTLPYQMQLAHGWTSLTVKINLATVLVIVPAIFWAVPRWGALGAAWIWLSINTFYVLVAIHFMYRRILGSEKWRWYVDDLLMPLMVAVVVAGLARWFRFVEYGNHFEQILVLGMVAVITLVGSLLAGNLTRKRFTSLLKIAICRYR